MAVDSSVMCRHSPSAHQRMCHPDSRTLCCACPEPAAIPATTKTLIFSSSSSSSYCRCCLAYVTVAISYCWDEQTEQTGNGVSSSVFYHTSAKNRVASNTKHWKLAIEQLIYSLLLTDIVCPIHYRMYKTKQSYQMSNLKKHEETSPNLFLVGPIPTCCLDSDKEENNSQSRPWHFHICMVASLSGSNLRPEAISMRLGFSWRIARSTSSQR